MIAYNSCRVLPIFLFDEIIKTKDLTLLGDVKEPDKVWESILYEYDELMSTYESRKDYRNKLEIVNLELKLKVLKNLFFVLQMNPTEEQLKKLEEIKKLYKISDIKIAISSTETLLAIKRQDKKSNTKQRSLDWQIARASSYLGYRIDKFKTTVSEWVETLQMIEERAKEERKWLKK